MYSVNILILNLFDCLLILGWFVIVNIIDNVKG